MPPREHLGVVIEWNVAELDQFLHDPNGELGERLMTTLAMIVTAGAKRRCLHRTGAMEEAITFDLGRDEAGLYADITSPVRSKRGFPYAIVHEAKRVRDRRPHRSLRPALNDIRRTQFTE